MRKDNKSGFKGVAFNKACRKWVATISVGRKNVYLGLHSSPEEAHSSYREAAHKFYGEFACV